MKTLYLIRHAKSSWDNPAWSDEERPLNARGRRDAPMMARQLAQQQLTDPQIYSSPAVRALTTARIFADNLGVAEPDIRQVPEFYEASAHTILQFIRQLPASADTVLLFGHNPTFTLVANHFPGGNIDNLPTCGIVKLVCTAPDWSDFTSQNTRVMDIAYPKQPS